MIPLESLLRQPLTLTLGWALLHFVWQGALIALLFGASNLVLRKVGASLRYSLACLAMLLMLATTVTTFLWLGFHPAASVGALDTVLRPALLVSVSAVRTAGSGSAGIRLAQWLDGRLIWMVALWSVGVVILSLRTAGGWLLAQTLKRQSTSPAEPAWQDALVRLARRLEVRRHVTLCESMLAKVPTVIGCLRPVILLPVSALVGLTPEMMEALLAHELAHIRRHDYLVNMLQTAVETLLFYHPAVWWIGKRIRQERENCCDDLAVAACGDALTYARALTELEQIRGTQPRLAMAATGGSLLARIRRLVGVRQPAGNTPSTWLGGIVALLAFGALWAAGPISISYHDRDYSEFAGAQLTPVAQTASSDTEAAAADTQAAPSEAQATPSPAKSADGEPKDFVGGLAAAGYQNLSVDQLITFKIHGVTPEFVREMEAVGVRHPSADQLVTMKIHDVNPEFVNQLKAAGFSGLSIDQLVSFKIHGVEPSRLAEMQKAWGKRP
jgi:beta-lactamase regulating signal transducer with metallopeptidase domain